MARVMTGIKPTGTPHLGNYLGMIRPALQLAEQHEAYYFIADYHALNTGPDPKALRRRSLEAAATFLALGLDPQREVLYRQSDVPEVCELAQILGAVTAKGLLNRAHAYKSAVADNRQRGEDVDAGINMGLYTYPLLMAADILAPQADLVPVGLDQQQHLEITRDIAEAFNRRYGPVLRVPEAVVDEKTSTVPGTDGRKMSKSYGNVIPILGAPDDIFTAVASIVTDSRPVEDPKDPDQDLIFNLFRMVATPHETANLQDRYLAGGLRYVDAKRELADVLIDSFEEARPRYRELLEDPSKIERILAEGGQRARDVTIDTLAQAKAATGLAAPS